MSTKNHKLGDQVKLIRAEAIGIPNEFLGCTGKIVDIQQGHYFVEFSSDPHAAPWCCGDDDLATPPERILCVAIKFGDLICSQPAPARHFHIFRALGEWFAVTPIPINHTQGFLTDTGRFVDRQEARKIAEAAGQLRTYEIGPDGVPFVRQHCDLFSEDVW